MDPAYPHHVASCVQLLERRRLSPTAMSSEVDGFSAHTLPNVKENQSDELAVLIQIQHRND